MQTWWRAVVGYPASWVAIAAVVAAVVAILVVLQPPTLIAAAVIAVGGVAVVAWPITLSATGTLQQLQFKAPELPPLSDVELEKLRADLERPDDPRPAYQLQAIGEKRDNLDAVLDKRLKAGELTYARYQSTAQQVYLAVISNLREVEIAKGSISAIDPEYIDRRVLELESEGSVSADVEMRSLQDRPGGQGHLPAGTERIGHDTARSHRHLARRCAHRHRPAGCGGSHVRARGARRSRGQVRLHMITPTTRPATAAHPSSGEDR